MLKTVQTGTGGATGALVYQGTWDALTNNPALSSGVGTKGYYYVVNVAGTTNLDGITDWQIGDWAVFNGTIWQKVDNTDGVTSVNGQTGTVVLGANDVGATANTTYVLTSGLVTGGGRLNANVTVGLTDVPVANVPGAVPNTVNVIAGTGLSGGGALTGNVTISLPNSGVVANTYGNATIIPVITVDAQGRITSASNVAISAASGTVTNVATGTGLTGGPITSTGTISIANTAVSPDTYGGSGTVPVLTINAQGQTTAASNVTIVATQANFSNTATTATLANASMMLAPEGYVTILINGVNKKIPYYGV